MRRVENDRVVLIGIQGLLEAAFGAQSHPAHSVKQRRARKVAGRKLELDNPNRKQVIEGGYELGQLFGRNPLRHHVARHIANVHRALLQHFDRIGMAYGRTDLAQTDSLQGEQVLFRHQSDQLFILDHQHMAEAVLGHGQRGFMRQRLRRQCLQICRHHIDHRLIQIDLRQSNALQHIGQGQNTQRTPILIHRDHGADLLLMHDLQHLPYRHIRRACYRCAPDDRRQGAGQRLLFHTRITVLGLDDLFGVFQQIGDAPRTEIAECGTEADQLAKIGRRQFVAEHIVARPIDARDTAVGQQRP